MAWWAAALSWSWGQLLVVSAAVVAALVARAVANALDALTALSAAVAECTDTRSVRDIARITGLPCPTVHRWKTEPQASNA
ncbi:MAG: helix-turn-helix domain-containing protein [Acidimicrobiales bacterium]|nr:helix-turn-helix domain-containing protein [Acidimicrobiales bacterium]MXZ15678.1 helix-turn-helix domain-containing protein [Acidimicrobiales bacterium]MYG61180.1 helix-turn-helix domain-containing protein [Acidimicrobiales bacterium]MYI11065.1 helix-turn-helix domain-containing protein [Acidimicrobiales bacterium]